ncbi:MAG: helix-turn-helix domain-containing protein [Candidatus Dormiibacterota bacterium]
MLSFDSNLRHHRLKAGYSQERLAQKLGVSRQTVVNIEKGENEPKIFLALALAALLGVAVNELFKRRDSL